MKRNTKVNVYFIGAGPGDPELITLKALKIIEEADIIIYAGSLVNKEILRFNKKLNVEIYNSANMTLLETDRIIKNAVKQNKLVARLHTGDPSIYGAIFEQMVLLEKENIPYEIIPGVSSAFAANAAIKWEFTLPEISQTVIFTRVEGRTPVPENEKLSNISKLNATLVIFLSINLIEKVQKELLEGYSLDTPVVIIKRVTWSDEEIFFTDINNMVKVVKENNIKKTALILVGKVFDKKLKTNKYFKKSYLYSEK